MSRPAVVRFIEKVRPIPCGGCWEWQGALTRDGYGTFFANPGRTRSHRFAYEQWVGPIPDGLELDHLCRNRGCCNPLHLEAVTRSVNQRRGVAGRVRAKIAARQTECVAGHPYTPENTGWQGATKRKRYCKTCDRLKHRRLRGSPLAGWDTETQP